MSTVHICGLGAVSPAGWGIESLVRALDRSIPVACAPLEGRPDRMGRVVPAPPIVPKVFAHPRMRRASPIGRYAVAAALEALEHARFTTDRIGIIFCTTCGPIHYTRRFFGEAVADPATASPLLFPETVFNAAASHLATVLGQETPATTLIGDAGVILEGISLAARWLLTRTYDRCLVIAAEELDWSVAAGWQAFSHSAVPSEGAAAIALACAPSAPPLARLDRITSPVLIKRGIGRIREVTQLRSELGAAATGELLCDGRVGIPALDRAEDEGWKDWSGSHLSPKRVLGEALAAAAGWQCVAAVHSLGDASIPAACVSAAGLNSYSVAARFSQVRSSRS